MKFFLLPALLGACGLALTACDKKPEATVVPAVPVPPPAAEEKFSDPGATSFLAEYKAFASQLAEAVKSADKTKLQPLLAKAGEFAAKGRDWAAKLKPDEIKAYTAKIAEFSKPMQEIAKQRAAEALEKVKSFGAASKEKLEALKNRVTPPTAAEPTAPAPPATEPAAN